MKSIILATTLLLAALTSASPTPDALSMDWVNAGKCALKSPNINAAINAFCLNTNIVVPSSYAKAGKAKGDILVHIASRKAVDPACSTIYQWVPGEWCRAQFHAICATSNGGFGGRNYGTGGCQHFEIKHLNGKSNRAKG